MSLAACQPRGEILAVSNGLAAVFHRLAATTAFESAHSNKSIVDLFYFANDNLALVKTGNARLYVSCAGFDEDVAGALGAFPWERRWVHAASFLG